MKTKAFDCVEMKHQGAERVMAQTRGMTFEQEVAYWRKRSEEFRAFQARFREQANRKSGTPARDGGT